MVLEQLAPFMFPVYLVIHVGLFIWGLRLWRAGGRNGLVFVLLISAALIYDNGMLALGNFISPGPELEFFNRGRFLLHGLITPLLLLTALLVLQALNVGWALNTIVKRVVWIITGLMSVGWTIVNLFLPLKVSSLGGLQRYTNDRELTPAWAVALGPALAGLVVIFMVVAGIYLWRRTGWPWLALISALVFIVNGATANLSYSLIFSNLAEIVFVLGMLSSLRKLYHFSQNPAKSVTQLSEVTV
jgi:hypothetical protein